MNIFTDLFPLLDSDLSIDRRELIFQERALRKGLSEKQLDKMIEDSFPASDPASNY